MISIMELKELKEAWTCESCGEEAVSCYDTQGGGYFWLCDKRDGAHSENRYPGTLVNRKPFPNHYTQIIKRLEDADKMANDTCDCGEYPLSPDYKCVGCEYKEKWGDK